MLTENVFYKQDTFMHKFDKLQISPDIGIIQLHFNLIDFQITSFTLILFELRIKYLKREPYNLL